MYCTISPLIFQNDSLLRLINSSVDNISALDTSSQRRIIQDYPYFVASYVILQLVSSLLGTVSNVLNICTFASMGFQDAVTIYLFALSVSDWGVSALLVVLSVCQFCWYDIGGVIGPYVTSVAVDFRSLSIIAGHAGEIFRIMSTLVTTCLVVTRLMCVMTPFHFRHVFTPATWGKVTTS